MNPQEIDQRHMKPPPPDFGQKRSQIEDGQPKNNKKMKKTFVKIIVLLIAVSVAIFFWGDIKNAIASGSKEKKSKGKNSKDKTSQFNSGEAETAGIIVTKKWDLPKDLTEISGLAYLDADRFACVQDETGIVFIYNTATSSIEKEIPFAGAGDYEGLAVVNGTAWVVRSDGHLFEISTLTDAKPVVKEYNTPLTVEQNIEGLCYDQKNSRLLVAIKDAEPGITDYKGIYAFDLTSKMMPRQPVFKIDLQNELLKTTGKKKKGGSIMPSSIAIHPQTGDMYITDGRNAKLLVMNGAGTIKKLYQLDNNEFAQPEGITFKPSGELYISNEGPKQPANILNVEISE